MGRQTGHHPDIDGVTIGFGCIELALGHLEDAHARFAEAVNEVVVLGVRHSKGNGWRFVGLGWTALARGDMTVAEQHFRQVPSMQGCVARERDAVLGLAEVCAQTGRRTKRRSISIPSFTAVAPDLRHYTGRARLSPNGAGVAAGDGCAPAQLQDRLDR